ncbi:MAG: PAS domain-containing sensor histidine kinase [Xanthobacteraceae bacterium]|nr:PAS domain-containing sensor histidine kinase [Xanthobacteraceae bacterium]QYK46409.1 MAG: PAS domain-containing sensor histidine kinase [Xanthobacteraceae bacterium]
MAESLTTPEQPAAPASAPFAKPPRRIASYFPPIAVFLALLSALATFLVLTGLTPYVPTRRVVTSVLLVNGAMVLILLAVVAWEVFGVIRAQRRGRAGARLHSRVMLLFGIVATVPAVLVAVVASITLDQGLDRWFSERTRAIIGNSIVVAETYVREHGFNIRADLVAMAADLSNLKEAYDNNRDRFRQILTAQAQLRGVPSAMLIRADLTVLDRADINIGREFIIPQNIVVKESTLERPIIYVPPAADYVAAIMPLRGFEDTYLYIARPIDPRVIQYLRQTEANIAEYRGMDERRFGVQVAFALMYAVIALILLLSSVWLGLNFANRLVAPIRRLITAADLVASGNLYVQVPVRSSEGDLGSLGESFNKMTSELRSQNMDLVRARDQIDQRRRFSEAVLAGVGAGVVGMNEDGKITIVNRSAQRLLGETEANLIGKSAADVVPELKKLVGEALADAQRVQGTVTIVREGRERTINVRVTSEQSDESEHGYVITLDDITELVAAQRTSAWADIARRIAHEIKNPLTPIQLSAERLRRKYGKTPMQDREVFEQCTETIIRQVGDIGRMVDEFSSFARMPKPVVEAQDLAETIRQSVFLQRVGKPEITYDIELPEGAMTARFDRRLISQALTNILKNAGEAVEAVPQQERGKGRILVRAKRESDRIVIDIFDNGTGLPKENRERLLEPYVTTREKGTGLGLAIVGKIFEEHGGGIELNDAPADISGGRGAWVRLTFAAEGVKTAGNAAEQSSNKSNQEAARK